MKNAQYFGLMAMMIWAPHFNKDFADVAGWVVLAISWACIAVEARGAIKR